MRDQIETIRKCSRDDANLLCRECAAQRKSSTKMHFRATVACNSRATKPFTFCSNSATNPNLGLVTPPKSKPPEIKETLPWVWGGEKVLEGFGDFL